MNLEKEAKNYFNGITMLLIETLAAVFSYLRTCEVGHFRALSELHGEHLIVDVRRTGSLTRSDDAVRSVTNASPSLVDLKRKLPHAIERLLAVHR